MDVRLGLGQTKPLRVTKKRNIVLPKNVHCFPQRMTQHIVTDTLQRHFVWKHPYVGRNYVIILFKTVHERNENEPLNQTTTTFADLFIYWHSVVLVSGLSSSPLASPVCHHGNQPAGSHAPQTPRVVRSPVAVSATQCPHLNHYP